MIKEERKDLVSRREFYYLITKKMNEKDGGATLNSCLNLREILDIFLHLPSLDDAWAEWRQVDEYDNVWFCSWCTSKALKNQFGHYELSRYCPKCGRRMKGIK